MEPLLTLPRLELIDDLKEAYKEALIVTKNNKHLYKGYFEELEKYATKDQIISEIQYVNILSNNGTLDSQDFQYVPLNIPFNLGLFKNIISNETTYFKTKLNMGDREMTARYENKRDELLIAIKQVKILNEALKKPYADKAKIFRKRLRFPDNPERDLDVLKKEFKDYEANKNLTSSKIDGVEFIPVYSSYNNSSARDYKDTLVLFEPKNWPISYFKEEDSDEFNEFISNLTIDNVKKFLIKQDLNSINTEDLKINTGREQVITTAEILANEVLSAIQDSPSYYFQFKRFHENMTAIIDDYSDRVDDGFEINNIKFYFKTFKITTHFNYRARDVVDFSDFFIKVMITITKSALRLSEGYGVNVLKSNAVLFVGAFDIISFKTKAAAGKKIKRTIYETIEVDGSENFCAYNALSTVYPDIEKRSFTIEELIKFIKSNELEVSVIDNHFKHYPLFQFKNIEKEFNGNKIKFQPLKKVTHNYIYEHKEPKLTLLYDYNCEHVDIIIGVKQLYKCDDIYAEVDGKMEMLYNKAIEKKEMKEIKPLPEYFAFYDFETVMRWGIKMIPYSFVILLLSKDELVELNCLEKTGTQQQVRDYATARSTIYSGNLCEEMFLSFINRNSDKKMIFTSFNGACFDHLILYDILSTQLIANNNYNISQGVAPINIDYFLKDCFWVGSRLMNFRIDGKHTMLDLRRHIPNSLKGCCKDFGLKLENSKGELDHAVMQTKFNNNEFYNPDGSLNVNVEELEDYNLMDVVSLAIVAQRYFDAYKAIISNVPENLINFAPKKKLNLDVGNPWDHMTSSSMMFAIWSKYIRDNKIQISNFDEGTLDYYNLIRKYRVGGRCDSLKYFKKQIDKKIFDHNVSASVDITSEYPYVMMIMDSYFPAGKNIKCNYVDHPKDLLGFYRVKNLDQSNLPRSLKIVPNKTLEGNSWHSEDIIEETFLSTPKIDLLTKNNCKFEVLDGFYCTEKIKSFQMFLPLFVFKNAKDAEDNKPKKERNGSIRSFSKIMMNSLSGKMNENVHLDKINEVTTKEYLVLSADDDVLDLEILDTRFGKLLVSYTKKLENCMSQTRAIHIGQLIYDYAHLHMYEHAYTKVPNYYYTDTDSMHCDYEEFVEWQKYATKTIVPHHKEIEEIDPKYKTFMLYDPRGKVFGGFDEELADKNVNTVIMCGKKQYIYYNSEFDFTNCTSDEDFDNNCKYSAKGISANDRLVEKDFICAHQEREKITKPELIAESRGKADQKNFEAYQFKFRIGDNPVPFFEELISTGNVKTLVFGIDKSIRNDSQGRTHATLHATYFVKDIKLSQNELKKVVINDNNFYYIE